MSDDLARERHGSVLVVRLSRPEARNALTSDLLAELGKTMLEAETDPGIRVAVLTGAGDRAFCAGMDLASFAAGAAAAGADEAMQGSYRLLRGELAIPLVGAANGTALAERIASNAPLGLLACKELVRLHVTDPARARERLDHWRRRVFQSEDAREGAQAFLERRAPVWQGR